MPDLTAITKTIAQKRGAPPPRMPKSLREFDKLSGFEPNGPQRKILAAKNRSLVLVCHRRLGKTYVLVRKLVRHGLVCPFPDGRYGYVAPSLKQARNIAWGYLKQFTAMIPGVEPPRETDLSVTFPTLHGGTTTIKLWGANNEAVRGSYFDGIVLDEFALFRPSVWSQEVRPALSDGTRKGVDVTGHPNQWAAICGTLAEEGGDHLLRMYDAAKASMDGVPLTLVDPQGGQMVIDPSDDWGAFWMGANDTGVIPKAELKAALRDAIVAEGPDLGKASFAREFLCDRDAAIPGSIFGSTIAELRKQGRIVPLKHQRHLPVHTAADLGHDDEMVLIFFQRIGNRPHIINYWSRSGANLQDVARVMTEKQVDLGYMYGTCLFPHDIEVTDLGTGLTRRQILRDLGVQVTTVPRVQHKPDSIAAASALLPECYIDSVMCGDLVDKLSRYRRKKDEQTGKFSLQPVHDKAADAADAFQNLAMGWNKTSAAGMLGGGSSRPISYEGWTP